MKVKVEPKVLDWACQRGGLDTPALLAKFPKLQEWKNGTSQPTLKQLETLAKKTRVPLGMFFLPEPPQEQLPIKDFRTMAGVSLSKPSPDLLETIYLCQQRQDWYRNYVQTEGLSFGRDYIGSVSLEDDIIEVATEIRHSMQFDLKYRQQASSWIEALRLFIEDVEKLNILVMISGVVGSNNKRKLNPQEFRGFALVDQFAPLIFINGNDTKAAQIFTLAHELAHVWLGEEGVSNVRTVDIAVEEKTESWCNRVAAELLVPLADLRKQYQPDESLASELKRLAKIYKVSTLVVLRRVYDLGAINEEVLRQTYSEELERLQKQTSTKKGSGGDFYRTLSVRVSNRFLRAVVSSTLGGQTLFRDTFKMLGIKKSATFYRIAEKLGEEL